jgi:outer membrane protein assembly factor BamA
MKKLIILFLSLLFFFCQLAADSVMRIKEIEFHGNKAISSKELKEKLLSKTGEQYNQKTALEDCQSLSELYEERGFSSVKVGYPEAIPLTPNEISLHFKIDEGEQLLINSINFKGNQYLSSERLSDYLSISKATKIPLKQLNTIIEQIVELYAEKGYLFAQVEIEKIDSNDNGLEADLSIDEGNYCRFENLIFEGNKTTTDKTILKISGLNQLRVYGLSQLQRAEENVRKKEYIKDFSIVPINHNTLLLKTTEEKMTAISGLIGYDSAAIGRGNRLTGFLNLKFLNLYGTDRELSFSWRRLHSSRESIEFGFHESGPFSVPIAADLFLHRETVDSTYISTTFDVETYYYNLRNKYGIYAGIDEYFPGQRRPIIIEKSSHKKMGVFWEYSSLDYLYNPTQGMDLKIKHILIVNKEQRKWEQRQATELHWGFYTPLTKRTVLMIAVNGKQTENEKLREYELYTLGGANSLRGFREAQFSGFRVGWVNFETRYLLAKNSRVFLFTDYGAVQYDLSDNVKTRNDLVGFGLGLRIETRIGFIGIDYGLGHSGGELTHPLDGMVHFSLETKF